MIKVISITLCLVLSVSFAAAKNTTTRKPLVKIEYRNNVSDHEMYPVESAAAAPGTTYLAYYTFDTQPTTCVDEGWTSHDLTAQEGDYFHVDDFDACGPGTFGRLYALEGDNSLWCGACPNAVDDVLCGYAVLPGYGDKWNQAFCTKTCVFVDSLATLDYLVMWDSEPDWDATTIEYTLCDDPDDDWIAFAGGLGVYDGVGGPEFVSDAIPVTMDSIRLRFHFESDIQWSDEDGLWDTDGAIIIDSLTVRDKNGIVVPTEDFEGETVGVNDASDWRSCTPPGYGDFAQLVHGTPGSYQSNPVQEDPCEINYTCMWNFYKGSTHYYAHNRPDPSPQQQTIPYGNVRDQYIYNEIWSPWIPLSGTGVTVNLEFDVYRDFYLETLTFYQWHIRSMVGGCATDWEDRGFWYWGFTKDWYRQLEPIGHLVEPGASYIQIALGVRDLCEFYCGIYAFGVEHSHAPLFDNVEVYRVAASGPRFGVEDIDMFQDNFATDGTITGTARADMAQDILPLDDPGILPGDSVCITVNDPDVGLGGDAYTGCGPAVYCYVSVDGHPGGLTAADIEAPETRGTCGIRFPYVTSKSAAGRSWYVYRMDSCFAADGDLAPDRYCIDFNDNVFTPGDTCWFFYGAKNAGGVSTYYSLPYGWSPSINLVASAPDEFTILPAVGRPVENGGRGGEILYVDGMNFRGAQPYFDSAFIATGCFREIDRYDVRGPSSGVSNRPGSRAVVGQLLPPIYRTIIYNSGDLSEPAIGNGADPYYYDKSPDCQLLANFLDLTTQEGGLWLNGDDIPTGLTRPGCASLSPYISFTLVNTDHVAYGCGVNPAVMDAPTVTACFDTLTQFHAYGGCPLINDFDVIAAVPPTSNLELNYHYDRPPPVATATPQQNIGGSTVRQTTINPVGTTVQVILEGYSFHNIRNYQGKIYLDGTARAGHWYDVIFCMGSSVDTPIAVPPGTHKNSLAQNYPNPFNPTTTIKYTIKEQAHVSLKVYNVAGQLVKTLVNEVKRPEEVKPVEWRGVNNAGQSVASGIYFYKLVTKNFTRTKKMVLLK